jgi:leader peptidase (prepilin peptidase) / N-methyltransferase
LLPQHRPSLTTALPPTGRCPFCQTRIGPPAAILEFATAALLGLLAARINSPLQLLAYAWLTVMGVALASTDLAVHRLPNALTLPACGGLVLLFGLAAAVDGRPDSLTRALLAGLLLAAVYLVLALIRPGDMGLGDIKLAAVLGTGMGWLSWNAVVAGTFLTFLLGGIVALLGLALGRWTRKQHITFGPFMLAGTLLALLTA